MSTRHRLSLATATAATFATLTDLARLGTQPANPRGFTSLARAGTGARAFRAHDIAMLGVGSAQVTQRR